MTSNLSVYELTNELIHNLHKDANPTQPIFKINSQFLKTCKKHSHESLLKKSLSSCTKGVRVDAEQDPKKEMEFCIFEMKLQGDNRWIDLQALVKELDRDNLFQTDLGKTVLWLLLILKSSVQYKPNQMAVIQPLELFHSQIRPDLSPAIMHDHPQMNVFTEMLQLQFQQPLHKNPYIPAPFNRPLANQKQSSKLNPFTLSTDALELSTKFKQTLIDHMETGNTAQIESVASSTDFNSTFKYLYNCNWDNLGNCGSPEYPFASESKSIMHLLTTMFQQQGQTFQARVVPSEQFIADVKALLVGIQSESFLFNTDKMAFEMATDLTVEHITPGTMQGVLKDIIECGTCFKRLHDMVTKETGSIVLKSYGFVYKTLCSSIESYLSMFRRFVMCIDGSSLMKFSRRMSPLMRQLRALARFVCLYTDSDSSMQVPRGSDFLSYVYRTTIDITQKDLAMLFAHILQQCCHVYFKNFEKWIFHGYIDDPCRELFVEFIDRYRSNTKYFWDKAYLLKRQSVPVFLQGFEDLALVCGKYTMLLKVCKPTHPLLTYPPPGLEVCLSFNQIEKIRGSCADYLRNAQQLCGEPISVVQTFQERAQKKQMFFKLVAAKLKENNEKWLVEQRLKAKETQMNKDRNLIKLQNQIAEIRERKLREKLEILEQERAYLRMQQELEDRRLLQENADRLKTLEYYRGLEKIVDDQRHRAESKIQHLKRQMSDDSVTEKTVDEAYLTAKSNLPSSYETARDQLDDDYDLKSIYHSNAELTTEFIEAFSKSAENISKMIGETTSTISEQDQYNSHSEPLLSVDDDLTVVNENFKKSTADELNSNSVTAALVRNKNKMLSSSLDFMCAIREEDITASGYGISESQRDKLLSSRYHGSFESYSEPTTARDTNLNEIRKVQLTDRARNKLKSMGSDFGMFAVAEVDLHTKRTTSDTARERNRRRMMNEEFGSVQQKSYDLQLPKPVRTMSEGAELSDLEKNRQKVLHEEFGYFRKEATKLKLDIPALSSLSKHLTVTSSDQSKLHPAISSEIIAGTPMSTGSDTPICDTAEEDIQNANLDSQIVSTNIVSVKSNASLKLDINLANSYPRNSAPITGNYAMPTASSAPLATPDIELCPLQSQPIKKRGYLSGTISNNAHNVQKFYKFPFNDGDDNGSEDESIISDPYRTDLNDLRSLNVTTITQFLQMSFVVPMQSYLSVLSNEILKMYIQDYDVLGHFKSLRNYFFMMDGEFGSYISSRLITCLENHVKPVELLNFNTLHTILENAIGSSIIANDRNSENLSFIVQEIPENFDLASPNVFNMLNLSYSIDWPLNLLLSPETINHYSKVFNYLLKLRRISWVLDKSFQLLKEAAKTTKQQILHSPQYRHVQQIRHKLLAFVNALQNHLTANALQASWRNFKNDLETANSMEELYHKHTKYLKRVEFLCMLNKSSAEFYSKLEDIFVTVLRFFHKLQSRNWRLKYGVYIHPNFSQLLVVEEDFLKLIKYIIHAGSKMSRRGYQTEIGAFIGLININGYY